MHWEIAPSYTVSNLIGNLPTADDAASAALVTLNSATSTNVRAVSFTLPAGTNYTLAIIILAIVIGPLTGFFVPLHLRPQPVSNRPLQE